jgi:hypothetical protein
MAFFPDSQHRKEIGALLPGCFFLFGIYRKREKSDADLMSLNSGMGGSVPAWHTFTLPSILSHDPRGEVGRVAAPRVLLLTPVLLFIMHRLQGRQAKACRKGRGRQLL